MAKFIKFKKVNFINGDFIEVYKKIKKGGLLVAPAASALVEILVEIKIYPLMLLRNLKI